MIRIICLFLSFTTCSITALSSNSLPMKKVAVIGGTGRLGREAVELLLSRKIPVRCLIRSNEPPEFLSSIQKQCGDENLVEYITNADVTDSSNLVTLLDGCTACLALHGATRKSKLSDMFTPSIEDTDMSHAKQVNYISMIKLLDAAKKSGTCNHIVRITGKGEDPNSFFSILINMFGSMAKGWNYEGEEVLRGSNDGVDYTIIRPGVMNPEFDADAANVTLQLGDNGADLKVSAVSHRQIAELCVESIFQPEYAKRTTLTAMNIPIEDNGSPALSLVEKIQKVQKDTRQFPASLIEEHKRAVSSTIKKVAGVFAATLLFVIFSILK